MKGSGRGSPKNVPKNSSPLRSSPPLNKGRQSVKVRYGLYDTNEASPSSTEQAASRKPPGNTTTASRPSPTTTTAPNPRARSKVNPSPYVSQPPAKAKGVASGKSLTSMNSQNSTSQQHHNNSQQPCSNSTTAPRKGHCEICQQPCRSHCAGCKRVFYCSKQHQQQDWSNHKLTCRPFSIPTQYSNGIPSTTSFNSYNNNSKTVASNTSAASFSGNLSPQLQFMLSTKVIPAGSILFIEKPLLVAANTITSKSTGVWCCSCLVPLPNPEDDTFNNNKCRVKLGSCPGCDIPMCRECCQNMIQDPATLSQRFLGGQGHSQEECALISDICQKSPELLSFKSGQGFRELVRDLTILRVLMFRTSSPWRWESLLALRNSLRYQACCKHQLGNMEAWSTSAKYPIANHYLKNICKERSNLLTEIIQIVAVFCEPSARNPDLLVLYENLSWLAHSCTANAENFYRQPLSATEDLTPNSPPSNLDIVVKAVSVIGEGCKITLNHFPNFDGGQTALSLKLFQSKGQVCCDSECSCHQQRCFDKTMGIRCDIIFGGAGHVCSGILSPRVDAPNPEKANLGMGIFMKSKKWECDKCKKSEKYESLHSKINQVTQEMAGACDRCCNNQQSYLQLQNKLLSSLSEQHWMVWKTKLRILRSWTSSVVGYGPQMFRVVLNTCPIPPEIMQVVKQKADLYGEGIYETNKSRGRMGVLELLALRHGKLAPKRGHLLYDAFFTNFILFVEDYKKELPLQSVIKTSQVAQEYGKKLKTLRNMLDQAVESLKVTEGTTLAPSTEKSLHIAKRIAEVLGKVASRVEQRPNSIINYLNDFLEVYTCRDPDFARKCIPKRGKWKDPVKQALSRDMLDFEVESVNLEPCSTSFIFGATTTPAATRASIPIGGKAEYSFGAAGGNSSSFGFGGFGSFGGLSDLDSGSDIDGDEDNPFVYSRSPRNEGKTRFSAPPKAGRNPSEKKRSGGSDGVHPPTEENWSDNLWFSHLSSDSSGDDEFDFGFNTSPRSTFGGDLFNEKELEDLAEWAAIQFMMGKMNI